MKSHRSDSKLCTKNFFDSKFNKKKYSSFLCRGKVVVQDRTARPWLMFNWIYKFTQVASDEIEQKGRLDSFTRDMIQKRRDEQQKGIVKDRKSLLEYMIEISERHPDFTDDDIVDETCTFMLAVRKI